MRAFRCSLALAVVAVAHLVSVGRADGRSSSATAEKVDDQLKKVEGAIRAGQLDKADSLLKHAAKMARRDWSSANKVVAYQAAVHAYRHEFERAAQTIIDRLPEVAKRRDDRWEFRLHNNLMMIRAAQGDVPGALLECYEMKTAGDAGTWNHPDRDRATQVKLKDFWHRALYLRLRALQVQGSQRKALLRYARRARRAYAEIARTQKGFGDSIAVLDTIFAVHDGNRRAALKAARRVDVSKNDDVEDLYLTFAGLLYGGDAKAARMVYEKMKKVPYVSHANAIMLMWADRDLAAKQGDTRWTPLHVHGKP